MAMVDYEVVPLADLAVGRTGVCFAVMSKLEEKINSKQEPYVACVFRAGPVSRTAKVWANNVAIGAVRQCKVGQPYRLTVLGESSYGSDLKILRIEPAGPEHELEGFRLHELTPSTEFSVKSMCDDLRATIEDFQDPYLRDLIRSLLNIHRDLFIKMPAAQSFHHAYNAGLLEHVWSLTKICGSLADHYANYYRRLDPPLNKDLILAAAIVHDIGKLAELSYDPFDATYTVKGQLIGHITLGRDMVRDAARGIKGFPDETLMLLEHAILSHHGRLEFGSPVLPKTLEALIVSYADELDAKINAAANARMNARGDDPFTERVKPLDGRGVYRGVAVDLPVDDV